MIKNVCEQSRHYIVQAAQLSEVIFVFSLYHISWKYVLYKLFYHRNFKHDSLKADVSKIETITLRINTGRTSNIQHFGYLQNPRNVLNITFSEY